MPYYHLASTQLAVGAIIEPGNWGRIIRANGWRHTAAMPSRLDAAYVFLTPEEARTFKQENFQGFGQHILYRVSLITETSPSHITDWRLCSPVGDLRGDWAAIYWLDHAAHAAAVPGIDWAAQGGGLQRREMLTLSQLRIEERLD